MDFSEFCFRAKRKTVKTCEHFLYHVIDRKRALARTDRDPQVIVSLTSFPARLEKLYICLESLFGQTVKPDRIILYLGDENDAAHLPSSLTAFRQRGLEIIFMDNIRSHKKYMRVMQDYPDSLIITADDDIIYPPHMIEKLLDSWQKYPKEISAMRCHQILYDTEGIPLGYEEWNGCAAIYNEPRKDLFFTSGGGTLFPPSCLIPETFEIEKIRQLSYSADDVWLNYMARLSGLKVVNVPLTERESYLAVIPGTQTEALIHENVDHLGNDACIVRMRERYGNIL